MYFLSTTVTVLLSLVFFSVAHAQELSPIVTLPNQGGRLQGLVRTSRSGQNYYAYLSIPYVERPTRFRESIRHYGWGGVMNATQDIPRCPQMSGGIEDCLFLNVYTPNDLNPTVPYATIVYIHGGGYSAGGAFFYGEKYMMDEQVIFVIINYRLGTLGYLNTGDGAADANLAKKDQRQALLWVRDNIHVFGGNNQNITLSGGSGGAVSIHYHLLSPMSQGLFQKAILSSLSAEAPIAFNRNPREYVNQLATKMNCSTDNTTTMVQCLQGKSASELVTQDFNRPNWPIDPYPFSPSLEWEGSPNRFIVEDPIISMKNGRFQKIPVLIGAVKNESLSMQVPVILRNPSMLKILNEDWNSIAPHTFMYENIIPKERWDEVSQKIKSFYFGDKLISNDTAFELEQLYNDITFLHGIRQSVLNIARQGVPVYPYFLDFEDEGAGYRGVPHGADFRYISSTYNDPITGENGEGLEPNSTAEQFSKNLVKLFASFAKTGEPVSTWGGVDWPRTSLAEANGLVPLRWLHLNQELTLENETASFTNRMVFWDKVFTVELSPIVTLPNQGGRLQGLVKTSRSGQNYYAYLAIPYVERPTRFRESVRHGGWTGVRNATQDIPVCPQGSEGIEDCLFLNVYTPNDLNPTERYATIVHIHGGGYTHGSALWFGEKYMMDEQVIFVNFNYRLGTLGYLNTGDGAAGANLAKKDQRQALLWVRDNIHVFGGNNQNITLFGESGGAVSIHYHILSPMSQGLFQKAILASLSAEAPIALNRNPREGVNQLATKMNCSTDNTTTMVQCLQGKSARELVTQDFNRPNWPLDPYPFSPSLEWEGSPNRFIVEDPIISMKNGRFQKIPVLIGAVKNESLSMQVPVILRNPSMLKILNEDWNSIAPHTFMYENIIPKERWDEVSQKIKSFYFGDKLISNDTAFELEQLYNDITFIHGIRQSILNIARQGVPVYPYFLDFEQEGAGYPGVPHGIDFRYYSSTYPDPMTGVIGEGLEPNSTAEEFSKNLVKLFVSFAKTGEPVSTWGGVDWPKTSLAEANGLVPLRWLHLNQELTLENETASFTNRMVFWDEVFTESDESSTTASGSHQISSFSVFWLIIVSIISVVILIK